MSRISRKTRIRGENGYRSSSIAGFSWRGTAPPLYRCSVDDQMSLLIGGPVLREEAPVRGAGASSGAAFFGNRTPCCFVSRIGRSDGLSPGPIVQLRSPGSPSGASSFSSGVPLGTAHIRCS